MFYIIRDKATRGIDFLIWGKDDLTAAEISMEQCRDDGIADDVELIITETPPMMTPCKFVSDDSPGFDGFAYGTTWNGFDNVAVTPQVLRQITQWFADNAPPIARMEILEGNADMLAIEPDEHGLISLAFGYATQIIED